MNCFKVLQLGLLLLEQTRIFDGDAALTQSDPVCGTHGLRLIRLHYGRQPALDSGPAMVRKLPAHLDVTGIKVDGPYALHTEFSGKSRSFDSPLLDGLNTLKASHRRGVPELWTSQLWSEELTQFIIRLVGTSAPPEVIEIHPPFSCTASTMFERMPVTVFDATCIIPPYLPSMPESIAVIPVSASIAPCLTSSRAWLTEIPR